VHGEAVCCSCKKGLLQGWNQGQVMLLITTWI
jgi:hypothetical protein